MSLYSKIVGHPFVFEKVRPLVVGGIDMSPAYQSLAAGVGSVIVDIGCGTGDALTHLSEFDSYLGIDTDAAAIDFARRRHEGRRGVRFECGFCSAQTLTQVGATHVCMVGLLHHLNVEDAVSLLQAVAQTSSLQRAVTLDIVTLPGKWYNNLIASLDRGRYCRDPSGYEQLALRAGLKRTRSRCVPSHPTRGLVEYFVMDLLPQR